MPRFISLYVWGYRLIIEYTFKRNIVMIKLIVFDMAGTVVNENNVVYKTVMRAVNEGGVSVDLPQVLADGAGKEKLQAITDIVHKYDSSKSDEAIKAMYQRFLILLDEAYKDLDVSPIDGAVELFEKLRKEGILVVLNTGYNRATAEKLIMKLGWVKGVHFDDLVTASDVTKTRPHPDMILKAMEIFGIKESAYVIKVGDSIIDIEEGKNARCGITVGTTTGAHTEEQLASAHPDYIIHGLSELVGIAVGGVRS